MEVFAFFLKKESDEWAAEEGEMLELDWLDWISATEA